MAAPEDITCRELVEIVTRYLEGALRAEEREMVELHLNLCDGCAGYLDQIRVAIELSGRLTEESISPEAESRLLEAFRGMKRG